jgi:hypothetical protein
VARTEEVPEVATLAMGLTSSGMVVAVMDTFGSCCGVWGALGFGCAGGRGDFFGVVWGSLTTVVDTRGGAAGTTGAVNGGACGEEGETGAVNGGA